MGAVFSMLQTMRTWENDVRLESKFPKFSTFDPGTYLQKIGEVNYTTESPRFNDAILRLALVRGARRKELVRVDGNLEKKRAEYIQSELESTDEQFVDAVRLEMPVGMLMKKIPIAERPTSMVKPKGQACDNMRSVPQCR